MATRSNSLAWKILWTGAPCGLQSVGSRHVRTEHTHTYTYIAPSPPPTRNRVWGKPSAQFHQEKMTNGCISREFPIHVQLLGCFVLDFGKDNVIVPVSY